MKNPLTPQEINVLQRLADGMQQAEVAKDMHVSVNTVKTYVSTARLKLNGYTTLHAIAIAIRNGHFAMKTDKELQTLRNLGNESEAAADEIENLRATHIDCTRCVNFTEDHRFGPICGIGGCDGGASWQPHSPRGPVQLWLPPYKYAANVGRMMNDPKNGE
jgi:DNA-binding CsgD family transcriptional regulator